jgi:hypothetical protein
MLDEIGLVCKAWRAAALANPYLWTHLELPNPLDFTALAYQKTICRLNRAGLLPKALIIREHNPLWDQTPAAVVTAAQSRSRCWQNFSEKVPKSIAYISLVQLQNVFGTLYSS